MADSNLGTKVLRWIQNPSMQFFISLLLAPMFAIAGEAYGGMSSLSWLVGLLLTFSVVALAGFRSYRHERASLPPPNIVSQVAGPNSIMVRYLFGVAMLSVLLLAAAIATAVVLLWTLWTL